MKSNSVSMSQYSILNFIIKERRLRPNNTNHCCYQAINYAGLFYAFIRLILFILNLSNCEPSSHLINF